MEDDYTELVVLCEDKQQEVFVRRFLTQSGVKRRRIRIRSYPAGAGSGEQWVRTQYPLEVREYRARSQRLHIGLLVMQDVDTATVEEACKELGKALSAIRLPPRAEHERIALFFPRRNIETWIRFLTAGPLVDESVRYPKLYREESRCHSAADRLAAKREYRLTRKVPASLRAACPEIRRLFPAKQCVEIPNQP